VCPEEKVNKQIKTLVRQTSPNIKQIIFRYWRSGKRRDVMSSTGVSIREHCMRAEVTWHCRCA